jgi:hypothetical protein
MVSSRAIASRVRTFAIRAIEWRLTWLENRRSRSGGRPAPSFRGDHRFSTTTGETTTGGSQTTAIRQD